MRLPVALVAIACLLPGCAGDGDPAAGETGLTTGATETHPPATTGTGTHGTENRPPTGRLAASVPGGAVPLNVSFTMTAEDPDGHALSWTLDADGDGEADASQSSPARFPATASFEYRAPGRYNATYRVFDGQSSITYQAVIDASGELASQSVTGSWQASSAGCGGPYDSWAFGTPGNGVAWAEFEVDAATIGRPFHMEFASDSLATAVSVDYFTADGLERVGGAFDTAPFGGIVPAGAVKGLVSDCGGLNLTFTYQTA